MSEDVQDRELHDLLEAAAGPDEPPPDALLPRVRRRGRVRVTVRWISLLTGVAVFAGSVAWAAVTIRGREGRGSPAAVGEWSTYSDPTSSRSLRTHQWGFGTSRSPTRTQARARARDA